MQDAATPETATANEGLDVHGAARAFEKIIRAEQAAKQADNRRRQPSSDATAEETPPTEEVENDDDNGRTDRLERQPDEPNEQPRYTVKIDGKEEDVTLDDLLQGYQRGADYTRKTMRLGDERRELETARLRLGQDTEAVGAERQQYVQSLDTAIGRFRQQLHAAFAGIDWMRLAAEDPARFAQLQPVHQAAVHQLQQAEAERTRLRQAQLEREAAQRQGYLRHRDEQMKLLQQKAPEFGDPVKAGREMAALSGYLQGVGYRANEVSALSDHRDILVARKAMLYDRLMEAKDKGAARPMPAPRVQRPGIAPAKGDRTQQRRAALFQRLKQTGRVEDAARLIESML